MDDQQSDPVENPHLISIKIEIQKLTRSKEGMKTSDFVRIFMRSNIEIQSDCGIFYHGNIISIDFIKFKKLFHSLNKTIIEKYLSNIGYHKMDRASAFQELGTEYAQADFRSHLFFKLYFPHTIEYNLKERANHHNDTLKSEIEESFSRRDTIGIPSPFPD